jgi:multidrug efflux pump subunit AcrA (membrane-fusion protein)
MFLKIVVPVIALVMLAFAVNYVVRTYPTQPIAAPPLAPPESPGAALAVSGVVEAHGGNVAVAAPGPGIVAEVFVEVGQRVSADTPLFRLDDRSLQADLQVRQARLATARAQLARLEQMPRPEELAAGTARVDEARANLRVQENQLERGQQLLNKDLLSPQEVERLKQLVVAAREQLARAEAEQRQLRAGAWEADKAIARAALAEAQALVDQINVELKRLTVHAPSAGTVLQVNVRSGEAVGDKPAKAPILLGDVRLLRLRVDIEEHEIYRFRGDASARAVTRGQSSTSFPLRFLRVEPMVVGKMAFRGEGGERNDSRVLQALYDFNPGTAPVYVGQQMDVFIGLAETP